MKKRIYSNEPLWCVGTGIRFIGSTQAKKNLTYKAMGFSFSFSLTLINLMNAKAFIAQSAVEMNKALSRNYEIQFA